MLSPRITFWRSVRIRILVAAALLAAGISGALAAYVIVDLSRAVEDQVLHEGLLFSNTLEATIVELVSRGDVAAIQDHIDRMVAIRSVNDLEINVLLVTAVGSAIVASNDPLNVGPASPEEHGALLDAIASLAPIVILGREDADVDPDDDLSKRFDPAHPDYYFRPGVRFVSITTPLFVGGEAIGSLNTKLSLSFLDQRLASMFAHLAIASGASLVAMLIGITWLLNLQLFHPLARIAGAIRAFGNGRLAGDMSDAGRRDEIGLLAGEFASMAERVRAAEASLSATAASLDERNQTLEQLAAKLAKYLSPQVYRSIFTGRRTVEIATERKQLTVFFSDIADFTRTTEALQPEDLTYLLNSYFAEMSAIALAHGATIDKFIGDAILMFFGDPDSKGVTEDARACVRMAVAMQRGMIELEQTWHQRGFEQPFRIRMGIHTGYCNVGNFGSEDRMDYTIIGRPVNLAARLQTAADPNGILVSFETHALVSEIVDAEERQPIHVKGIDRPIRTFAVTALPERQGTA